MKLDFGMDAFFHLFYTVITYKEIRVSPKIRALLSGTPSGLRKFRQGRSTKLANNFVLDLFYNLFLQLCSS